MSDENGDITNQQLVAIQGESIVVLALRAKMTKCEALVHAAWIVALADQSEEFADFRAILKSVINT